MRRVCFRIHLWTGLLSGAYMVLMSVTGSAIVFRGELGRWLTPVPRVVPAGRRRTRDELVADAERALPQWSVTELTVPGDPTEPAEIRLRRGQRRVDKIFNPYSGDLIGERVPREPRSIERLADLHDNLLAGPRGRFANGVGALALTVLCITGAVVWWPRAGAPGALKRRLTMRRGRTWRRTAWSLHTAVGFWMLALLSIWAVSGVYLALPTAFDCVSDVLDRLDADGRLSMTMYRALGWMSDAHFGRFAGNGIKILWVVLGLTPALLFMTGAYLWWTRAVKGDAHHAGT
jgi:uncharacterized iron-regulated membrane protein